MERISNWTSPGEIDCKRMTGWENEEKIPDQVRAE